MGTVTPQSFMADLYEWVKTSSPDLDEPHHIGGKLGVVKIRDRRIDVHPWGHGAYSESGFSIGGTLDYDGETVAALTGRFTVVFSDRASHDEECLFDLAGTDLQDITLFEDGKVRVVLVTWGHTTLWLDEVTCYSEGFLTGIRREGNGDSLVTLALRKQLLPSDGVWWP